MQESQKNQSSHQQKQQSLGNQKQIILGQDELDTYVANLSEDITKSNLFELFGLRTTTIAVTTLISKCNFLKILGKKGFAYVKVPRHVSDDLLKSHGIGFKGKTLV